jgi:plasmid stabilization system protein ParE
VIRLSRTAQVQVSGLAHYYEDLDRPEAAKNLRTIVAKAGGRIETRRGLFFPAPRPYPNLARPGWIWLKEGAYWIAYTQEKGGAVIQAIFHEAADIPRRI